MADRRMFSKTIIDSDAFIDMSVTARLLYYDLGMRADDDGFVNSPKKIMKMIGASEDDMRALITRKFIIPFDSGVVVIKHWRIHNYIQKDRYKETNYKEEKALLTLDENNSYSLKNGDVYTLDTECIQDGYILDTQDRLGKDSIGKSNNIYCPFAKDVVDYLNLKTGSNYKHTTKATLKHINARYKEGFTLDDFKRVIDTKTKQWINDPKMKQYLRPETLFSTKFESYLNQQEVHTFQGLPDLRKNEPVRMLSPEEIEEENNKHYDF